MDKKVKMVRQQAISPNIKEGGDVLIELSQKETIILWRPKYQLTVDDTTVIDVIEIAFF